MDPQGGDCSFQGNAGYGLPTLDSGNDRYRDGRRSWNIFYFLWPEYPAQSQEYKPTGGPIGNPAMPVPIPNISGMLPGMTSAATKMLQGMFNKHMLWPGVK